MRQPKVKPLICVSVAVLCCVVFFFGRGLLSWFRQIRYQADQAIGFRVIDSYRQEQLDMRSILLSIRAYRACYGQLPFTADTPEEIENRQLVSVLMGKTNDIQVARRNPKGIKFLSIPDGSLKDGEFIDPWGHPYHIFYDPKRENKAMPGSSIVSASVTVWSSGPNGINEYGQGDDLLPQKVGAP